MGTQQHRTDTIYLAWSVAWIAIVGVVVVTEQWRAWNGLDYLWLGMGLALPCVILPCGADL